MNVLPARTPQVANESPRIEAPQEDIADTITPPQNVQLPIPAADDDDDQAEIPSPIDEIDAINQEREMLDEYISNILIDIQLREKISNAGMENILKAINKIGRLRGVNKDIVPPTHYLLLKHIDTENHSIGMKVVCPKCFPPRLMPAIFREKARRYATLQCPKCRTKVDPAEEIQKGVFIVTDIEARMRTILQDPNLLSKISFCDTLKMRQISTYGSYRSGEIYRLKMKDGDLSFALSSDGARVFKSSSTDFWPQLLCINESDRKTRRKYIIPSVVYYGPKKPSGKLMLSACIDALVKLANEGLDWTHPVNGSQVNTKIRTLYGVFDAQAKPTYLNILTPTGHMSCPFCYASAQKNRRDNAMEYGFRQGIELRMMEHYDDILPKIFDPYNPIPDPDRIFNDYRGVCGRSPLMDIPDYDVFSSTVIDTLHLFDAGITKYFLRRFIKPTNSSDGWTVVNANRNESDRRMEVIKPPSTFVRKVRPYKDMDNWKASEFNSWLLYYFPIVMRGLLRQEYYDHFFIFCAASSDILKRKITNDEVTQIDYMMNRFVEDVDKLYPTCYKTLNLHVLQHAARSLKQVGSFSDLNSYLFEDVNGAYSHYVKSSKNVAKQIVTKDNLRFQVNLSMDKCQAALGHLTDKCSLKGRKVLDTKLACVCARFNVSNYQVTHQYSTYIRGDTVYTSVAYHAGGFGAKTTSDNVVKVDDGLFFVIECFVEDHNKTIFAIGTFAASVDKLSTTIQKNNQPYRIQLHHYHQVKLNDTFDVLPVSRITEKSMYIDVFGTDEVYCVDIFYKSSF